MTIKVEKTIEAVCEWLMNVGANALPQMRIPPQSAVGRLMAGAFGIDPSTYNVWNELGFLLGPTINSIVAPKLGGFLESLPEEGYEGTVMEFVDSFIQQARSKGYVDLFGIQLGENAFVRLREILQTKLNQ
jgi:hypothetical protein